MFETSSFDSGGFLAFANGPPREGPVSEYAAAAALNGSAFLPDCDSCLEKLFPCSQTVVGNLILMCAYGFVLSCGAKLISDGAEMLLEVSNPVIVGGLVLPILGALPDAAMILVSGLGPDAQQQLSVGVGTLAGSTIMLLTIPWLGGLLIGRCDIGPSGDAIDKKCSKFGWFSQGVTVLPEVAMSAKIMIVTLVAYFIISGPSWARSPGSTHTASLVTAIVCFLMLAGYCAQQVMSSMGEATVAIKNEKKLDHIAQEKVLLQLKAKAAVVAAVQILSKKKVAPSDAMKAPLLQKSAEEQEASAKLAASKAALKWKLKSQSSKDLSMQQTAVEVAPAPEEQEEEEEEESELHDMTPGQIWFKALYTLFAGLGIVGIFSDPMCDVLSAMTNPDYTGSLGNHIPIDPFFVSFIVTPICSNASELISSLAFAAKKTKKSISMTYAQLYGAATLNNTLCLGVFALLIYVKQLQWKFTAEVVVIILVEVVVGIVAFRTTYKVFYGVVIAALYVVSIALIVIMDNVYNIDG